MTEKLSSLFGLFTQGGEPSLPTTGEQPLGERVTPIFGEAAPTFIRIDGQVRIRFDGEEHMVDIGKKVVINNVTFVVGDFDSLNTQMLSSCVIKHNTAVHTIHPVGKDGVHVLWYGQKSDA